MAGIQDRCGQWSRQTRAALLALVLSALTAACGPTSDLSAAPNNAGAGTKVPSFALTITPDAGTKDLPVSSEIGITLAGGEITDVTMTKAGGGEKVTGSMRDDGTAWIPATALAVSTTYDVSVTGRSTDGSKKETRKTSFSTMGKPGREMATGLYLGNAQTVGVGMPVVIDFETPVADSDRAGVQKRLFVTTNPPQPGVWHWATGTQVWYRAPNYWQPGTTITVRAGLAGHPMGNGYYGDKDRSATVTVGPKVVMEIDNATKQMSVYQNDALTKTIPVSLGKASTPTSSGHMVVMSKDDRFRFDTRGEPDGGYVVDVDYAMRLTAGGEFLHSAPWSVGDQGVRNVSHGCVNMSYDNSQWLFGITHIGDPVIVKGTEVALTNGNGWTAWNMNWAEYVKGSALPVPAELANAGAAPAPAGAAGETAPR